MVPGTAMGKIDQNKKKLFFLNIMFVAYFIFAKNG